MTGPHGLPYPGALDAVKKIEDTLAERDAAREASESELDAARAEAERLLSGARAAGTRAGAQRRLALRAQAETDAEVIRSAGDTQAGELGRRLSAERDVLVRECMALLLNEEP
jgi:vacuolar-type H+-ATPase subunit H